MARWRLNEPHYIDSPDSYWEQRETDRESGKQKMRKHMVPLHLNPKDPNDWNWKTGDKDITQGGSAFTDGEIIICREGKGKPKDIVFTSPVTPGMEPLDDEAKAETAEAEEKFGWKRGNSDFYRDGMTFADKMMEKLADRSGQATELTDALAMMAKVMEQNAQLLAQLAPQRRL